MQLKASGRLIPASQLSQRPSASEEVIEIKANKMILLIDVFILSVLSLGCHYHYGGACDGYGFG
jgi:hypothetical protein